MAQRSSKKGRDTGGDSSGGLIRRIGSGILKGFLFVAVITVLSITFLSFYNYLLTSPYMKLEQVTVKGAGPQMRDELIQLAGLDARKSLLGLHLYDLREKIKTHPWIRTVKLERRFPHTLVIEVEKQVPEALVYVDDFYYVNQWGEVFKAVSRTDDMDFPVITGFSEENAPTGDELGKAIHVLNVLKAEKGPWSVPQLSEIHLGKDGATSLYFSHFKAEIRFVWDELAGKIDGLKKVVEHLNTSGKMDLVTCINLNYSDGAVVSFENG